MAKTKEKEKSLGMSSISIQRISTDQIPTEHHIQNLKFTHDNKVTWVRPAETICRRNSAQRLLKRGLVDMKHKVKKQKKSSKYEQRLSF